MTDSQLVSLFQSVKAVEGVLQVYNTDLTAITFTKNIRNLTGDPLDKMLSISNNTKLISIDLSALNSSNGRIQVQNNPTLDLKSNCPTVHSVFFTRRLISGNLFDCGCELKIPFKWPDIRDFPKNCIVLYGNIVLEGASPPPEVLYRLSSITILYGYIMVSDTNLETLGFLQNLEEIESGPDAEFTLAIRNNFFLSRLDLVKLRSIKSRNADSDVEFSSSSGDLCVDPAFIQTLAQSDLRDIKNYDTLKFCPMDKMNNPSLYCSGKLSSVNDRCTMYIGNMLYFNEPFFTLQEKFNYTKVPEADYKKMQQFEVIFGTIHIEASNLTSFTLPNLKEIYQIEHLYENYEQFYLNNVIIAYQLVSFADNTNLTTDDDFCRRVTNGTKRMILGFNSDYDCRPYMAELTTL
ncbi:unnamed protein product [Caenorhabditis sp. 36 PRJEB53466]|nr:unnamed protein product [Caenorhabditis sp. 36 PRJEB53466]